MKVFSILYLIIFCASSTFFSQEESKSFKLITGLNLGSTGVGVELKYPINRHTVRLGFSYLPLAYSTDYNLGLALNLDVEGSIQKLNCMYEFQPFLKQEWFKLQAGLSYLTNATSKVILKPTESVSTGIISLNSDEIGEIVLTSDSRGLAPYIGLGLGRTTPKKKLNVTFDIGVNYLKATKITSEGTKLLSNNQQLGEMLTEKVKTYRWLPVIQMNINYLIEFKKSQSGKAF
ncbi:MAG: hypothetical protein KA210_02980 [Bacteroidia bacterium]|nr:hypothetical protein [Bacteroidia bacterium]